MEKFLESIGGAMPGIITVVLVLVCILIFTKPIRFILKLLINTLIGFVVLILINKFGSYIGVTLGVNWINAAVVGILGVPGVALLLILRWLMTLPQKSRRERSGRRSVLPDVL